MFVIPAMAAVVFRYVKPTWPGVVFLGVVGTLFTVWTFERNRVWMEAFSLYRDCAEKSSAKARTHNNFGAILLRRGRLPEAIAESQAGLRIKPD
jgi:hypothetical protein